MSLFNRITIIGLGLIGGSLGLAIKKERLAREVVGASRRRSTIIRAMSMGAIDRATLDIKESVKGADLVIIAAPVLKIIDIAGIVSGRIKKGAILTDVGSTKKEIVKKIERFLLPTAHFVGSHPLAGSEKSGVRCADRDLFKGVYCILTKTRRTSPAAIAKLEKFWSLLGMEVIIMDPGKHDAILSRLSHLPHAASVAICNAVGKKDLRLAAGGFKDTTRIASGEPELWEDIFVTNRNNLARDIRLLQKELSKIETALRKNNKAGLLKLLKKAKAIRDSVQ